MGDGGGGHWLVRMEWRPAGWSVFVPLLISPCTIKSRSSLLTPAHLGGPWKRAVKRLCVCVCVCVCVCKKVRTVSIPEEATDYWCKWRKPEMMMIAIMIGGGCDDGDVNDYSALVMITATVRIQSVHFDECRLSIRRPPTLRPRQPTCGW